MKKIKMLVIHKKRVIRSKIHIIRIPEKEKREKIRIPEREKVHYLKR